MGSDDLRDAEAGGQPQGSGASSAASHQPGQVAGTPTMPESPAQTGDPRPDRQGAEHIAAASNTPAEQAGPSETKDAPPGQEHQPEQGRPATGEPAPEEIGESG